MTNSACDIDDDFIPISLVANYIFCPRRAWLESVGERVESSQMAQGFYDHRNVDKASPSVVDADSFRAIEVRHRQWGVCGRLDAVQMTKDGLIIREYKATPVKRSMTVTESMRVQLALQSACLEDMGYRVTSTEIFFTTHHRRITVDLKPEDYQKAEQAVKSVRQLVNSDTAPEPLEDDSRCLRCSHVGICLPEERKLKAVTRRNIVVSADCQVTHLATPGAKAFSRGGRMVVYKNGQELASVPLDSIQGIQVHGNTDLSSGLIRELMWRDIPILWCSGSGRLYGWSVPSYGPNGAQRIEQHVASHEGRLGLAREFIIAKVHNQRVLLRRSDKDNIVLPSLKNIEGKLGNANRWQEVLGLEGEAASLYFSQFGCLIKPEKRGEWPWSTRMRRPAPDALNALLDYAYTLLLSDCVRALISCGLDTHAGFLHSSKRNKPALALDLMEEFRAPVADSVVQTVVNNGEVKAEGFVNACGSVRMTDPTRKALIGAYERRMATEIMHPIFKYKASWRRVIEIQARMILGYLDGSQTRYRGIRIR
ncbi:CRISPR-associated endonuclease Cas1 [Bifidobacterium phasiani]|uniref:CRISPR-associated endonuclease Cas1 n=1 Tax=Bifidobacterium phasiani TaxID=2834431 RepID=A0ABS6W9E0_9BIFI|nr:CRISPR-associated endonuclease Cas1 [Bifidobacterium phasiani]MBW3083111.1 CRISPR-associated endonuclease Cas1 [Bifidobacterium phasiani]